MADPRVRPLLHPKEVSRGLLMSAVGAVLWALIAILVLTLLFHGGLALLLIYGFDLLILVGLSFLAAALYRARAFGNAIMLGERQFPELHAVVRDGAARLGLPATPTAFLFNSNGIMNAFARRLLGGSYVFLSSALVEHESDAQVRFVIGHELGHHAAGHLDWKRRLLHLPANFVPLLYPAYSRGRELSCDRIGLHLSGDLRSSRAALAMLGCGCGRLNSHLNCDAFAAQDAMVGPFAGLLLKLLATHPRLTTRVGELFDFARNPHTGRVAGRTDRLPDAAPAPG